MNDIKSKNKQNDNVKSCLQIDKQSFQDTISLVDGWKYNPFDPEIKISEHYKQVHLLQKN